MVERKVTAQAKADRGRDQRTMKLLLAAVDRLAEAVVSLELRVTAVEKRVGKPAEQMEAQAGSRQRPHPADRS